MTSVQKGTTCQFGIAGSISNMLLQSVEVDSSFDNSDTVKSVAGITIAHRMDDRVTKVKATGITTAAGVPVLGAAATLTLNTSSAYPGGSASSSFSGYVTNVKERSTNKGFVECDVDMISYEGIGGA